MRLGSADNVWAGYSSEPLPMFDELRRRPDRQAFFAYAQSQAAPFFLGGTLKIDHDGRHPATNEPLCNGVFSAEAYSTRDSSIVGSSTVRGTSTGTSTSDCAQRLSLDLAERAAGDLGPAIQRHWRTETRRATTREAGRSADQARLTSGPMDWTIIVQGADLGMGAQADLMDALAAVPGIENPTMLSQSRGQLELRLRYSGDAALNLAIYRKLSSSPAFTDMDTQMTPGQLIICQTGC